MKYAEEGQYTVGKLIDKLSKFNKDLYIFYDNDGGWGRLLYANLAELNGEPYVDLGMYGDEDK
jgi:DNA primase